MLVLFVKSFSLCYNHNVSLVYEVYKMRTVKRPVKRSLRDEFLSDRGQHLEPPKQEEKPISRGKKKSVTPYDTFIRKYNDFENNVDTFSTRELVYYLREIAQESGYKYVIANIKKDMAIMKRLLENYSTKEICAMIEFLYVSEQDYIDKNRVSVNLLGSQWINTIYADTMLWVEDKYTPHTEKKKSYRKKSQHEWDSSVAYDDTIIGAKL